MLQCKRTILFSIFIVCGLTALPATAQVTKEQAIKLAEQFIIDNGYTKLPADTSKLSYEILDFNDKVDDILKWRHNALQPKAFCFADYPDSWHIGFLSSKVAVAKLSAAKRNTNLPGRAVIVEKDGREIRIAHKEPAFSYFIKL